MTKQVSSLVSVKRLIMETILCFYEYSHKNWSKVGKNEIPNLGSFLNDGVVY